MPPNDFVTEMQTGEREDQDLDQLLEKADDNANVMYE